MERIKLHLTDNFSFSTSIPIRITDINYGGHLANDVFLSLIHEARQQFLQHHGYTELQIAGVSLIMADAAIEFKAELYHRNMVDISVAATGFDKLGFDLHYLLTTQKDGQTVIAGKAKTGMICFDYCAKKKVPVPEEARLKLTGL
jgi:acyl-CoA thioester hydrolase